MILIAPERSDFQIWVKIQVFSYWLLQTWIKTFISIPRLGISKSESLFIRWNSDELYLSREPESSPKNYLFLPTWKESMIPCEVKKFFDKGMNDVFLWNFKWKSCGKMFCQAVGPFWRLLENKKGTQFGQLNLERDLTRGKKSKDIRTTLKITIFAGFWNLPHFSPTCFTWGKTREMSKLFKNYTRIFFPLREPFFSLYAI